MDQQAPAQTHAKKVKIAEIVEAPPPFTGDIRPSVMTLRIYDVCAEHGAHTDPDLQQSGYVERGI